MKNSITISMKKDQVIIRVDENAEQRDVMASLKKKIIELKNLYKEDNVQIDFDSPKELGLHGIKKSFYKEIATSETKFHKGSLRSGQKIEFEGSLVIIGDVNPGAQVIAGENIIVLGQLRGLAHAGAKGNRDAVIEAVEIDSLQLRIADIVKEIEKDDEAEIRQIKTSAYLNESGEMILE